MNASDVSLGAAGFRVAGARSFDVICAGASSVEVTADGSTLRIGGGAARSALALARHDLRTGVATILADDPAGRATHAKIAATGVDVSAVVLAPATSGLFFVRGGALQSLAVGKEEPPITIPEDWSAPVLLLSGMSPSVSSAAALCKAARAARRVGAVVLVDLHADWNAWKGRNWRSIRMILREAGVVWASGEDLVGLNLDLASARATMRESAVFVSHVAGKVSARGLFGEVAHHSKLGPVDADDDLVAAIAFELVHARGASSAIEKDATIWSRAFARS
jgi:sugar/nucleoside kinase (ribokinase family)